METTSAAGTLSTTVVSSKLGTTDRVQTLKTPDKGTEGEIQLKNIIKTEQEDIEFEFLTNAAENLPGSCPSAERTAGVPKGLTTEDILDKLFKDSQSGKIEDLKNLLYGVQTNEEESSDSDGPSSVNSVKQTKVSAGSKKNKQNNRSKVSLKRKIENDGFVKTPSKVRKINAGEFIRDVDFKDRKNVGSTKRKPTTPVKAKVGPSKAAQEEVESSDNSLIDYSVLTKALADTIETKLKSDKESDIKIVIFCNNEPIQSFSVTDGTRCAETSKQNPSNSKSKPSDIKQEQQEKSEVTIENDVVSCKQENDVDDGVNEINGAVTLNGVDNNDDDDDDGTGNLVIDFDDSVDAEVPNTAADDIEPVITAEVPEQFECVECGKSFKLRKYLNRHIVRCHKQKPAASSASAAPVGDSENNNTKTRAEPLTETIVEEVDVIKVKEEPVSDSETDAHIIQNFLEKDRLLELLYEGITSTDADGVDAEAEADTEELGTLNWSKDGSNLIQEELPVSESGEVEPVFVCEQCGRFYRARKGLKDHYQREHAKEEGDEPLYIYIAGNKYQCSICFHNFHSASDLLNHTKIHTGELRSPCPVCGKVYSSVHVLRRHIENIHSDVRPRPFQCTLCDYAASNKWHLKEHHRRHTGEQPYTCPVCQKSFSHQGTMNRHCKTIHKCDSGINTNKPRVPLSGYLSASPEERAHSLSPAKDIPATSTSSSSVDDLSHQSATSSPGIPATVQAVDQGLSAAAKVDQDVLPEQLAENPSRGIIVTIKNGNVITIKTKKPS